LLKSVKIIHNHKLKKSGVILNNNITKIAGIGALILVIGGGLALYGKGTDTSKKPIDKVSSEKKVVAPQAVSSEVAVAKPESEMTADELAEKRAKETTPSIAVGEPNPATPVTPATTVTTTPTTTPVAPAATPVSVPTKVAGSYVTVADFRANSAKYSSTNNIYFFHAGWCPTCQGIDKEIKTDPAKIPTSTTIIKTDFDSETALRQKFGVTTQYTFVQVDASGNLVKKWSATNFDKVIAGIN
jgi:thioredoxin 1